MSLTGNCSFRFEVFTSNVALAGLNLVSAAIAVSSNVLILVAFYQTRSLRVISNFFIASLAVSDLLVGLTVNPVYAVINLTDVSFDSSHTTSIQIAENWLWFQSVITSTFNLTAISLDRYIAVTSAFRYTQVVTQRRCIFGAVFIWTFSTLFASIRFLIDDPQYLPGNIWLFYGSLLQYLWCFSH